MRILLFFLPVAVGLASGFRAVGADRPVVATAEAAAQAGKAVTVRGRVIEVRRVANGPIIFEIDGRPAAPAFRALVYPMAVRRFGSDPETIYLGKVVETTGMVIVRRGLPQTWINDPSLIRVADDRGTTTAKAGP